MRTLETNSDALVRLCTGRVAVANDHRPAVLLVNDIRTRSAYQLASTVQYEPQLSAMVVAKGRPGLRATVLGALTQLPHCGVYAEVPSRWHVQDGAVQQITINSSR